MSSNWDEYSLFVCGAATDLVEGVATRDFGRGEGAKLPRRSRRVVPPELAARAVFGLEVTERGLRGVDRTGVGLLAWVWSWAT